MEGLVVVCWLQRRRGIGLFRYPCERVPHDRPQLIQRLATSFEESCANECFAFNIHYNKQKDMRISLKILF